jgi:hypothetical protein
MSRAGKGNRELRYRPVGSMVKTWPDQEDLPPDDDGGADPSAAPVVPRDGGPVAGAEAAVVEENRVSLTEDYAR